MVLDGKSSLFDRICRKCRFNTSLKTCSYATKNNKCPKSLLPTKEVVEAYEERRKELEEELAFERT